MDKEKCMHAAINCVEVKGMNGLSLPYIKRFFGHAGAVQDAKKVDDKVVVRFKHKSSINKAFRFNGRIVDKEPIKIRDITASLAAEEIPEKRKPGNIFSLSQPTKQETMKIEEEKYSEKMKYGPLDVPYHWAQFMKILDIVSDPKTKWILHELFALELMKAFHLNFFKQNSRSSYNFLTIKELFLTETKHRCSLFTSESSVEKMQISSRIPTGIHYQPQYESYANDIENRVRARLTSFKEYGLGHQPLHLYSILYRNGLFLSEGCSFVSDSTEPEDKKEFKKIQLEINTRNHIQISVQEWPNSFERSEYRGIDDDHPSKQIQILSDSCFHENASSVTIYDIFKDAFDGTIDNTCVADIFHRFHPYFCSNYLLVRHIEGRKIFYIRLDFELRILNANGQILEKSEFNKLFAWKFMEGFNEIFSISMTKHNLVLSSFDNPQKIFYLVTNYITYFCQPQSPNSSTESQNIEHILNLFIVVSNPSQESKMLLGKIFTRLHKNDIVKRTNCQMYIITIDNEEKFQETKCKNYIQNYVDNYLTSELTLDIAKFHAKQLLYEHPEKFKDISNPLEFVEQTLWGVYLVKSKRKAKNQIMTSLRAIRGK